MTLENYLDSVPAHTAILDSQGVILRVNKAWRDFAMQNGASSLDAVGIGTNYFDVCRKASEEPTSSDAELAVNILQGAQFVIHGYLPSFQISYPCHSPTEKRWFLCQFQRVHGVKDEFIVTHTDITRVESMNDVLRDHTARLKLKHHIPSVGVFRTLPDGSFSYINQKFADILEGKIDELRNTSIFDYVIDNKQHLRTIWRGLADKNLNFKERAKFATLSNKSIEVYWEASKEFNARKLRYEIVGTITDISLLKIGEKLLENENKRFQLAQNAVKAGMWDWDAEKKVFYRSPEFRCILGLDSQETSVFEPLKLARFHPDDVQRFKKIRNRHLLHGDSLELEARVQHAKGHYIWIRGNGFSYFDDSGKLYRIIGVIEDIDAQKKLEISERRWSESFNLAVKSFPEHGVWAWDLEHGHYFWSDSYKAMLGYPPEENFTLEKVRSLRHPKDAECYVKTAYSMLESKGVYETKARMRHKSGEYRWFVFRGAGKKGATGDWAHIAGSMQPLVTDPTEF